jgi:hypothetical protein
VRRPQSAKQPDSDKYSHTATDIYSPTRIDRYTYARACDEYTCRNYDTKSRRHLGADKYRCATDRDRSSGEYTAPATANRNSIPRVP